MRNILIVCSLLLITIFILTGKYFGQLAGKDHNVTKALTLIPSDAALIINFNNDEAFYEIFKDYELFTVLLGYKNKTEISEIQKFISLPPLQELSLDKKIFISLHPSKDSIEILFTMNLSSEYSKEKIHQILTDLPDVSIINVPNSVYRFNTSSPLRPFYIHIKNGVAIASFSSLLLNKSIGDSTPRLSKTFIEEINKSSTKSQSTPINLFVNYNAIPAFFKNFTKKSDNNLGLLNILKGTSSLSMNFKSDALMFNGISTMDTLQPAYFNLFLHQKASVNTIKNILPINTADFTAFGLSDPLLFQKDLRDYFKRIGLGNDLESNLLTIRNSTGINLEQDLKPQLSNEFVSLKNWYNEKFAIIKVVNGRNLNFTLQLISRPINDQISQVNYTNIFYYYLGDPFKNFKQPYFAVVDNYLIIANTPGIIKNYLADYENERFLSNTEGFKRFGQLVANQCNILFFIHVKNSLNNTKSILKPAYSSRFFNANYKLNKFYGLTYQWTGDGDHFFTNFYLSYPLTTISLPDSAATE